MHIVPTELTAFQKSFAHALVADPEMNQTQAYLKLKPESKPRSAAVQANRLLKLPQVRQYVATLLEERQKRLEIDEDWVMSRLRDIHDRCIQATPVWEGARYRRDDETGEMEETEPAYYKFDATGALKALELMGRHMRMFSDKVDSGSINVGVQINLGGDKPAIEGEYKRVNSG